ncbi:MAG: sigma-54-dependent Fis family transcriptional regulator [Beggiatoa sp. IS2]|nr:MAG: sigma-54-dependent Fis family transcriptional regulator [Beggiatoa sp. IS2]
MLKTFSELIGNSADFLTIIRTAQIVAVTDVTVLILGESGTGKELLAQAIHQHSRRASKPFITINCAALPETLAESELFGHQKGAFTTAVTEQRGRIQTAGGGTLFLDEIGELPLTVQAKLLRFLESGECQPVGKATVEKVDTRVLVATNSDLATRVRTGQFRKDLYYRLNVVPIELPPLRQRSGDLDRLLMALTRKLAEQHQLIAPRYAKETLKYLRQYSWPGNVRELRNFCERMLILFSNKTVYPSDLPIEFRMPKNGASHTSYGFALPETGISLDTLEMQIIQQALEKTHGNLSQAARLLGLTRDTLHYRVKKYAIEL